MSAARIAHAAAIGGLVGLTMHGDGGWWRSILVGVLWCVALSTPEWKPAIRAVDAEEQRDA